MSKSLYNIREEHLNVLREIQDNDGELTPDIEEALALSQEEFEEKAVSYGYMIKTFENNTDIIDKEIQRLKELKEKENKWQEVLINKLTEAMKQFNIEEIKTPTLRLFFRKSESIEILNESEIPNEFIDIKESKTISKTRLKEAIKAGNIIGGAELVKKDNLQIK